MNKKTHILITNQHGENRGDEAALRAMLEGINSRPSGDVKFTLIVQFQDTELDIQFDQNVDLLHMNLLVSYARFFERESNNSG